MMDRIGAEAEWKFDEGKGAGYFEGYGAVFHLQDNGGDVIEAGAFKTVLGGGSPMPKMLYQHAGMPYSAPRPMDLTPVGVWTNLYEDAKGLCVEGQLINLDTESGKRIHGAMKAGALSGLSIGYRVGDYTPGRNKGDPARRIKSFKALSEISIVTFPMNESAEISSVKSFPGMEPKEWRDLEAHFRDGGFSRSEAVKAIACLKSYPWRDAGGPNTDPRDEGAAELVAALQRAADRIRA